MDPRQDGYGQQQHRQRQAPASQQQHQRFSWQAPLHDSNEREPSQQHAPPQNTSANSHSRVFSYAQTPVEHRAFYYNPDDYPVPQVPSQHQPDGQNPPQHVSNENSQSQAAITPIDPRPQSFYDPRMSYAPSRPQQTYHSTAPSRHEPPQMSPVSPPLETNYQPLSPVSPMIPQPLQVHTHQPNNHTRQRSNLSPINTNLAQYNMPPIPATPPQPPNRQASPLPQKAPITPISAVPTRQTLDPSLEKKSGPTEPYSPHNMSTTPTHAIFSPHSAHGPNGLDFALHQPGQVAHPNMDLSSTESTNSWKASLCACSSDISTCLTGLFCPCILYGRTAYRLSQKADKKDPTDMLGHDAVNAHCMLMSAACGLWCLFPMVQRTRIRHAYKLGGGFLGDLARACCCCCCVAVQNEREVRGREEGKRMWAGPASAEVYKSAGAMVYKPQQ